MNHRSHASEPSVQGDAVIGSAGVRAAPARHRSRLRRVCFRIVALAVSLAVTLALAELALRLNRGDGRFYPHHPNAVHVFYPDESYTPGVSGTSYLSTNSLGCRGPERNGEKHALLTVGGSTTACTMLDDAEAWPQLLMDRVNERIGDPEFLWVTNSGIDGKNSRHHLMHAQHLVPRIPNLDFVLVYCGLNDVGTWLYHEVYDDQYMADPRNVAAVIGEAFRESNYTPPDRAWFKHLELYKRAARVKAAWNTRSTLEQRKKGVVREDERGEWMGHMQRQRQDAQKRFVHRAKMETLPLALDAYERNLRGIVEAVRRGGAEPIFMAQSIQWQNLTEQEKKQLWMGMMDGGKSYVDEEEMQRLVGLHNERLRRVADDTGAPFIDLPKAIEGERGLFYDGSHFNESGARRVADVVAERLIETVFRRASPVEVR
jgi:hypothetical protein